MRQLYEDGALWRRSPMVSFDHQLDGTASASISRYRFGGAFESAGALHDVICIIETVSGRYEWESGDERGTGRTVELSRPGVVLRGRTDDAETRVVTLDIVDLIAHARDLYGGTPRLVTFDGAAPVSPELQRTWQWVVDLAEQALRDPELDAYPLIRVAAERQLKTAALTAFKARVEPEPGRRIRPATVQQALRYLDEHAHEPITIDDAARHVGTPTAALDAAVRAHTGRTLAGALRRARIDGATEELLHADHPVIPDDVVRRWGFRTAGHYTTSLDTHLTGHDQQSL